MIRATVSLYPTNRMIVLAAIVATPVLGVAGWVGAGWAACALALIGMGVIAAIDALLGKRQAAGIRVSLEGHMHATQGRSLEVGVKISGGTCMVRVALDWPDHCETAQRILETHLSGDESLVNWEITPHQRGEIRIDSIHHECLSPLRLWSWRRHSPAVFSLRVYPALLEDRGVLAPLFLRRPATGLHVMRQIGKGREFEQLREYLPGDSYEDVDWKSTARRGKPITKIHQIERTQDVYIIVDASRRSQRRLTELETTSPHPLTQMDRFVRGALALSLTALQQGDRPGLAVFGPAMRHFLRAAGGQTQYAAFRDSLFDLQARSEPPDFADFFADLGNRLRQRALLLFLTDLDDPMLSDQFC
ncbi:MAG TPA: DUF58 domain-containing protein, partial [Luteolibacter sp.]|nr:DUF58 domain-containing protein [Luteolibacter sp.]